MFPIPTGNETDVVKAYYTYLYTLYYANMSTNRATEVFWGIQAQVMAWLMTMVILFYFFTYFFSYTHYAKGALYETTSFAGTLFERNGRVSIFTWSIIIGLFLAGLYIGVRYILYGFLY